MALKWFPYSNEGNKTSVDISLIYNSQIIRKDYFGIRGIYLKNISSSDYTTSSYDMYRFGFDGNFSFKASIEPGTYQPSSITWVNTSKSQDDPWNKITKSYIELTTGDIPGQFIFSNKREGFGAQLDFDYIVPKMQGARLIKSNIYEDIEITLDGNTGNKSIYFLDGTSSPHFSFKDKVIIPKGTITQSTKLNVRGCNKEDWDTHIDNYGYSYESFDITGFTAVKSQLYNLQYDNSSIQNQTTLNWLCQNQEYFKIEIYQGSTLIYNNQESTSRNSFLIPKGVISSPMQTNIKVYVKQSTNSQLSDANDINISFGINKPSIYNLLQVGNYYEKDIEINWRSENQVGYEYELYQNNVKIGNTVSGNTETKFIIPANTFTQKDNCDVRVRLKNTYAGITEWTDWSELSLSLKEIAPSVDNLALSGSNIDLDITISWQSEWQEKFEIEGYKDGSKVYSNSGTTAKNVLIPKSSLTVGLHIFKIRVAYKDRWTNWISLDQSLTETLPFIGILEPDGRILDKDVPIRVYWTSVNQSRWNLEVTSDQVTNKYNGTNETEYLLPSGLLKTGRISLKLTVHLDIANKDKQAVKVVEFIAKGIPSAPTITSGNTFTNNRPTFTWDTSDQAAFYLQILKGKEIVYSSGWVNGLIVSHKINEYIENGSYTVNVKVKNTYAEESKWSVQQITINAPKTTDVNLKVYNMNNYSKLTWESTGYNKFYIFRNDVIIGKTSEFEFYDFTCVNENIYKVRAVNENDVFIDSKKVLCIIDLDNPVLSINDEMLDLIYKTSQEDITISVDQMSSKVFYSGRKNPITSYSEFEDVQVSITYAELKEENYLYLLRMIQKKVPILYRSNRYNMWLTFDNVDLQDNVYNMIYNLDGYKIDYIEAVNYD